MPAAHILMTTTVGPMTLELDADNSPKTVENFLSYVSSGFYDGTTVSYTHLTLPTTPYV